MTETMTGYNGKIAYIDLTKKEVVVKPLDPEIAEDYIGGTGLSAKLIHDLLTEEDYKTLKKDPYDSVNPLVYATGPVTGTMRPASGRYSVSGIFTSFVFQVSRAMLATIGNCNLSSCCVRAAILTLSITE